ncbi:Eukaryotic translation initiation factor 2A (eIF-2A) [Durusdinium trenchii]|uniref:Eukaryotic translation initiation factor 2A (eIF-2A) n=1 Tax=Durusdinium trenchii TaxID=1381693 RepID=A0ABP0J6P1_9DINO
MASNSKRLVENSSRYTFRPGETVSSEPDLSFPAAGELNSWHGTVILSPQGFGASRNQNTTEVSTAESCEWGAEGALLGLVDPKGGVQVLDAADGYKPLCQVPALVGGVRNFYFSPLGNHLVTYERWEKDGGNNVGVWDAKTGEMRFSFTLKNYNAMTWPPLKWTAMETHCCRMVQDAVQIMPGNCDRETEISRIEAPGIMAFEVAPKGAGAGGAGAPHVALCIAEWKGQPARCQVFRLDEPKRATATKNFFKAQAVTMSWNNTGTAVLVKASTEEASTGKSYYGDASLYFLRADGEETSLVASADGGPLHDVQWNPTQDEFVMLHGQHPCSAALYEGRKASKRMDFGTGHRNTIRWNNFGRFFTLGGYGQLKGDTDFWDKPGKKLMASTRMECCVVCGWAPDGRHFLTATTAPRMRVDNKIEIYDYLGSPLGRIEFDELLLAGWRPRPRGAFQDRPPTPGRTREEPKAAAKPKATAYRPPGARGGALAEQLRKELGSTAADGATTATKVGGPAPVPIHLPPGASAADFVKQASNPSTSSRNARKKKAKAEAKEEAPQAEPAKPAKFSPPQRGEAEKPAEKPEEKPAAGEGDEVEKKIRALRKKLRDIEKLKEKASAGGSLDPLQKQKLDGEAEILQQQLGLVVQEFLHREDQMVKIVQSNLKLQHLDLRYNRIGDMGAQTLSRSLKEHGMQILDLQDNAICRLGAEMLYANCGRRLRLKLSCNSVPSYQLVELEEQLEARREEERQLKEAQMKAGKGKKNRPASGQSKTALSKPGSQQSKSSKESKPSSSQRRMSRAPSMGTLSEMS